jgi:hypothetical protein
MPHPLVLALFDSPAAAVTAARALRDLGIPHERVSVVARSHDVEGVIARASGASPGAELEDSLTGSRLGELGAHLLSAIALVLPGIGPIVADGPLAASLSEITGHAAGGIARTLEQGGLDSQEAGRWEARIEGGAILVGAHITKVGVDAARRVLAKAGAERQATLSWPD